MVGTGEFSYEDMRVKCIHRWSYAVRLRSLVLTVIGSSRLSGSPHVGLLLELQIDEALGGAHSGDGPDTAVYDPPKGGGGPPDELHHQGEGGGGDHHPLPFGHPGPRGRPGPHPPPH